MSGMLSLYFLNLINIAKKTHDTPSNYITRNSNTGMTAILIFIHSGLDRLQHQIHKMSKKNALQENSVQRLGYNEQRNTVLLWKLQPAWRALWANRGWYTKGFMLVDKDILLGYLQHTTEKSILSNIKKGRITRGVFTNNVDVIFSAFLWETSTPWGLRRLKRRIQFFNDERYFCRWAHDYEVLLVKMQQHMSHRVVINTRVSGKKDTLLTKRCRLAVKAWISTSSSSIASPLPRKSICLPGRLFL